jgi:hypothetical protein
MMTVKEISLVSKPSLSCNLVNLMH